VNRYSNAYADVSVGVDTTIWGWYTERRNPRGGAGTPTTTAAKHRSRGRFAIPIRRERPALTLLRVLAVLHRAVSLIDTTIILIFEDDHL